MSDPYLNLVRDWAAVCDAAGVEGDASVDEIVAAFRAAPSPALTREALRDILDELEWPTPLTGTGRPYLHPDVARWSYVDELLGLILAALGTPPPAGLHPFEHPFHEDWADPVMDVYDTPPPTSTREENL